MTSKRIGPPVPSDVLVESLPFPVFVEDGRGRCLFCNSAYANLVGCLPAELVGRRPSEYGATGLREFHIGDWLALQADDGVAVYQARIVPPHGGVRQVMVYKNTFAVDRSSGVVSVMVDVSERLKTEKALIGSEELRRSIVESHPDTLILVDLDLRIQFISRVRPEFTIDEVVGRRVTEFLEEPDRDRVEAILAEVFESATTTSYRVGYQTPAGEMSQWETRVAPVTSGGRVVGLVLSTLDVTELAAAQERLEESEARYRSLVEDQTEMIVRWLPDGTRLFVNEAYCLFVGLDRSTLLGSSFMSELAVDDRTRLRAKISSLTPDRPVAADVQHEVADDGGERWVEWRDRGFFDGDGELVEVQSVGRDISRRVLSERVIRESEQRYRFLTESIHDVILTIDLDERWTYVSPSVERMLGYPVAEIRRRGLRDLMDAESYQAMVATLADALADAQADGEEADEQLAKAPDAEPLAVLDLRLRHAEGHLIEVEVIASLIRDDERRPVGILAVVRDLSGWARRRLASEPT